MGPWVKLPLEDEFTNSKGKDEREFRKDALTQTMTKLQCIFLLIYEEFVLVNCRDNTFIYNRNLSEAIYSKNFVHCCFWTTKPSEFLMSRRLSCCVQNVRMINRRLKLDVLWTEKILWSW